MNKEEALHATIKVVVDHAARHTIYPSDAVTLIRAIEAAFFVVFPPQALTENKGVAYE